MVLLQHVPAQFDVLPVRGQANVAREARRLLAAIVLHVGGQAPVHLVHPFATRAQGGRLTVIRGARRSRLPRVPPPEPAAPPQS